MKALNLVLLAGTIGIATQGLASSYQIECSNPQGTIRTSSGHAENQLTLTEYVYGNGELKKEEITLSLREVREKQLKSTTLFEENRNNCNPGGMAVMSSKSIYHSQVRFENADGSLFSKDISGVSQDQKSIEAFLICERFITNIMPCDPSTKK